MQKINWNESCVKQGIQTSGAETSSDPWSLNSLHTGHPCLHNINVVLITITLIASNIMFIILMGYRSK